MFCRNQHPDATRYDATRVHHDKTPRNVVATNSELDTTTSLGRVPRWSLKRHELQFWNQDPPREHSEVDHHTAMRGQLLQRTEHRHEQSWCFHYQFAKFRQCVRERLLIDHIVQLCKRVRCLSPRRRIRRLWCTVVLRMI